MNRRILCVVFLDVGASQMHLNHRGFQFGVAQDRLRLPDSPSGPQVHGREGVGEAMGTEHRAQNLGSVEQPPVHDFDPVDAESLAIPMLQVLAEGQSIMTDFRSKSAICRGFASTRFVSEYDAGMHGRENGRVVNQLMLRYNMGAVQNLERQKTKESRVPRT